MPSRPSLPLLLTLAVAGWGCGSTGAGARGGDFAAEIAETDETEEAAESDRGTGSGEVTEPGADVSADPSAEVAGPDAAPDSAHADAPDDAPADVPGDVPADAPAEPPKLALLGIEPVRGPVEGVTTVTLSGSGFAEGMEVFFGDAKALYPFVITDAIANCSTPPQPSGTVSVKVRRPDGAEAVLHDAFSYESALTLASVSPASGPASGGTPLVVRGTGLASRPIVLVGGRVAIAPKYVDDSTILVVAPPGPPGRAAVIAVAGSARARLADGYEYLAEPAPAPLPGVAIASVSPASGPPEGGTAVTVKGTGFAPGAAVRVGPLPATAVEWVSSQEMRAVTPPGSAGPADVAVEQGGGAARLPGGFEYDPGGTRVLAVEPDTGSWAGGAWVRVFGWGLRDAAAVTFGAAEAVQKEVVSPVEVVARTPRSDAAGPVPVIVFAGDTAMGDAAFAYFDPRLSGGGTWGGPIRGALNVTVLNGSTGKAVPEAFVVIGTDPHTPLQGRTDDRGQLTLSVREGLAGPVTVHGTRLGFSAYTVADFDAANVTFHISPEPSPESPGDPPPGAYGDCTVRGRIRDWGKYLLKPPGVEGEVTVRCAASAPSMFGSGADPGPKAVADAHGRFEIVARTGEFAVVCSLTVQGGDEWWPRPLRTGIVRHLSCAKAGDAIGGVEVALSMEMDGEMWVHAGRPPEWAGGVNGPFVSGGWELGTDGYLATVQHAETHGKRLLYRSQPREFTGPFEGYGYSFYSSASAAGTMNGMPYGVTLTTAVPPPGGAPVLVGGEAGLAPVPTLLRFAVTAMRRVADGTVLAADRSGRTYWFNGTDFYLGQVTAPGPILGLWGDGLTDFWAVGAKGAVWRVIGAEVTPLPTGVWTDLTGVSGEGPGDAKPHVAGGPFLMRWDGTSQWLYEAVPPGADLNAVRRFPGGDLVAVGKAGALVIGPTGGVLTLSNPVAADLAAVDGESVIDAWVVGAAGTVLHLTYPDVFAYTAPGAPDLHGLIVRGPCDVIVFGDEGAAFEFDCESFNDRSRPDADVDLLAGALFGGGDGGGGAGGGTGVPVLAGRHYVRLPRFLPFATLAHPADGSVWSRTLLSWTFPPDPATGEPPDVSYQQVILSGGDKGLPFWMGIAGGGARDVPLPDFGAMIGYTPIPEGQKRMNLTCSRTPGFDIDAYGSADIGYYRREAFTVNLATFDAF